MLFYVYTPVDGNEDRSPETLEQAKELAKQYSARLKNCGVDSLAYVIDAKTGEYMFSCE
jgi:hypothetical protein